MAIENLQFSKDFCRILDDDVDLRRLKNADTKLILATGSKDEFIPCDAIIDYYNEVNRVTFGSDLSETRKNDRFFLLPGNEHGCHLGFEEMGPSLADAMMYLMRWVEDGIASDYIHAMHIDLATGETDLEGEVHAY